MRDFTHRPQVLPLTPHPTIISPIAPAPPGSKRGTRRRAEPDACRTGGTQGRAQALPRHNGLLEVPMKGIIAWFLGVPIVVIILLYVFNIF